MGHPALDPLAARIEADLRTRFPGISITFQTDEEGTWMCVVTEADVEWGRSTTWFESGDELSPPEAENLLASVAFDVADNLWPDELTDPWPLCPRHHDHPLQVKLHHGRAAWVCARDSETAVRVGELLNSAH